MNSTTEAENQENLRDSLSARLLEKLIPSTNKPPRRRKTKGRKSSSINDSADNVEIHDDNNDSTELSDFIEVSQSTHSF